MATASRCASRFMTCSFTIPSHCPSIELFLRQAGEIDALERPGIDGGHLVAFLVGSEGKRLDAAALAELVRDEVPVELVGGELVLRRLQPESVASDEPEKRALARADGAVALQELRDLALSLEFDVAAVAASGVSSVHIRPPSRNARRAAARRPHLPPPAHIERRRRTRRGSRRARTGSRGSRARARRPS